MASSQMYGVLIQKQQTQEVIDISASSRANIYIKIFAFIIFVLSVIIFNTKIFRYINFNKLSIYLILVVLVSLFTTIQGTLILCGITVRRWPNIINYVQSNYLISVNIVYATIFISVVIFLITFIFFVNKKVKYIKFLTKEVKVIKNTGFGKTIEVRGSDELAELCESINDMSLELGQKIENEKKIEQNKNELITNVSHYLKTPLTSIVGYLEILNNNDIDEKTKDEYIKIAYNKSLRLKSLVNELFEYTKLTGNDIKLDKHKVNVAMLLNQVVGESIINFIEKDIEVELDNPYNEAFVNINAVQILRVFEKLIRKAEKIGEDIKFNIILDEV